MLLSRAPIEYVLKNSAVAWLQPDVGGTPHGIPWSHGWDAPLWTLIWEDVSESGREVLAKPGPAKSDQEC
jgi:hypothetical protein